MPPIGISRAENCKLRIYYMFELSALGCVNGYDHNCVEIRVPWMALDPNLHSPSKFRS